MTKDKDFIKVNAPIIGADGNIFNLIAIASRSLKHEGYKDLALVMSSRVMASDSYDEALNIIMEYIEPVEISYSDDHELNNQHHEQ